jgi:TPR repeat protein
MQKRLNRAGFRQSKGVKQNNAEAKKWYQLAADQGHAEARRDLEWMCENSRG